MGASRGVINHNYSGTVLGRPAREGESPVHEMVMTP